MTIFSFKIILCQSFRLWQRYQL